MRFKVLKYNVLFQRWSYVVPLLCYLLFFCMIWTLSVPLKPISQTTSNQQEAKNIYKMSKNTNINSEKDILNEKNEYLVNVNDENNKNKNQVEILEDVFKRYTAHLLSYF